MVRETLARRKIREAVEAKGWSLAGLMWEPVTRGSEKCGPFGGWHGDVYNDETCEFIGPVLGLSWQEAVRWIEDCLGLGG